MNPILAKQDLLVNEESKNTIQRCVHDQINPYSMISNNLIRDESISPNCRWLLIYLLSNKDGWKISVQQVINHLKPHMGRTSVYKLFDEAINAGYMCKEDCYRVNPNGSSIKNGIRYIISETPKFKKCFRHSNSRHTGNADTGDSLENDDNSRYSSFRHAGSATLRINIEKKNIDTKEKQIHTPTPQNQESPHGDMSAHADEEVQVVSSKSKKKEFSQEVKNLTTRMIQLIIKYCQVYRPPADLTKFMSQVEYMVEKDKQDVDMLMKTFEWAVSDNEQRGDFRGWQGIICTNNKGSKSTTPAEIFRKYYSKINSQMCSQPKRKFAPSSNSSAALEAMEKMNRYAI